MQAYKRACILVDNSRDNCDTIYSKGKPLEMCGLYMRKQDFSFESQSSNKSFLLLFSSEYTFQRRANRRALYSHVCLH